MGEVSRAAVITGVLGCVGVIGAALIGANVGRNQARTEQQRDTAPTASRQQASTVPTPTPATGSSWQEPQRTATFTYKLSGCTKKAENVRCTFSVVAEQRDRRLLIWGKSRLVDTTGKEYRVSAIELAGNYARVGYNTPMVSNLVRGVPISGSVEVEGVPAGEKTAAVIELVTNDGVAQFRDVPLNAS